MQPSLERALRHKEILTALTLDGYYRDAGVISPIQE